MNRKPIEISAIGNAPVREDKIALENVTLSAERPAIGNSIKLNERYIVRRLRRRAVGELRIWTSPGHIGARIEKLTEEKALDATLFINVKAVDINGEVIFPIVEFRLGGIDALINFTNFSGNCIGKIVSCRHKIGDNGF